MFLLGGVVLVACRSHRNDGEHEADYQRLVAFNMCKSFVEGSLKAPSTAKFPGFTDSSSSTVVTANGSYTVVSYVDAQNSFGAMLRNRFVCRIQPTVSGAWTLLSLDIQ